MTHKERCEKVVAALQRRGYVCEPCREDDADFVVRHADGSFAFKLQVWGALVFSYRNTCRKDIRVAFCDGSKVYCYLHNETLDAFTKAGKVVTSRSWQQHGYWFNAPPLPPSSYKLLGGTGDIF